MAPGALTCTAPGLFQSGIAQVGSGKIGAVQSAVAQVGRAQVGLFQVGVRQIGFHPNGLSRLHPPQRRAAAQAFVKSAPVRPAHRQIGLDQPSFGEVGLG